MLLYYAYLHMYGYVYTCLHIYKCVCVHIYTYMNKCMCKYVLMIRSLSVFFPFLFFLYSFRKFIWFFCAVLLLPCCDCYFMGFLAVRSNIYL